MKLKERYRELLKHLEELKSQAKDLARETESLLFELAQIAGERAGFPKDHGEKVAKWALLIADELELTQREKEALRKGILLRDIGMMGIPEDLLRKRVGLTDEEKRIIESHTVLGYELCKGLTFLEDALPIIRHHHERWDGRGYPDGLSRGNIPLLARIAAVVDSYYALLHLRPYREALTLREALGIMAGGVGAQWDPMIVQIFINILREKDGSFNS
jgi:HD-GYP domain-containing protein (c-di-GMP phosphodiesterase class II)